MDRHRFEKFFLKIVSLIFGIFIWFYVLNSEPVEVEHRIPLAYLAPKGMSIAEILPRSVKVILKGPRSFVNALLKEERKVTLDLRSFSSVEGRAFDVFIDEGMIPFPLGVTVESITPSQLKVSFEKEIKKSVAIKVEFLGTLASELKLVRSEIFPKTIEIQGPRETLRKIGQIKIMPIDLNALQGNSELPIQLAELDPRVNLVNPQDIVFKYWVRPNKANLTVEKVPIRFVSIGQHFRPQVQYVTLDVLAPEGRAFDPNSFRVLAEIPSGQKGTYSVSLEAQLPADVHLLQMRPQSIKVSIR